MLHCGLSHSWFFVVVSALIILATARKQAERLLFHYILLFVFVLLRLQFCVYTIEKFGFF